MCRLTPIQSTAGLRPVALHVQTHAKPEYRRPPAGRRAGAGSRETSALRAQARRHRTLPPTVLPVNEPVPGY